jgi:hypothetical protein
MSANETFDGLNLDFLYVFPILTHFFQSEQLNKNFQCFLSPQSFCGRYQIDNLRAKKNPMLVHHLGPLQPLHKHDMLEHFWVNMFGGKSSSLLAHLSRMDFSRFFPYVYYSIKPKLAISTKSEVLEQILSNNYRAFRVEARLFPFGAATIHFKFYTKKVLSIKDAGLLERALRNQEIFCLNSNSAKKLGLQEGKTYTMQTIFEKTADRIRETFYMGQRQPIDNHRQTLMLYALENRFRTSL